MIIFWAAVANVGVAGLNTVIALRGIGQWYTYVCIAVYISVAAWLFHRYARWSNDKD